VRLDNRRKKLCKIRVYRYDDQEFADGQTIESRGDSFSTLTDHQKTVEAAIRTALPNGAFIRGYSLYTWVDAVVAKRLWRLSKKKYLYELEIHKMDIRHKGDLNHYSEAVSAAKSGASIENAVGKYCAGEIAGAPYTEARVEVLVSKATVVCKLAALSRR
jgi:hypothetical protein